MAGATIDNINIVATADVSQAINNLTTLQNKLSGIKGSATKAAPAVQKTEKAIDNAGKTAKKASNGISQFAAAIKRVVVYRMLRGAIKAITNAFSEGAKNAYLWAQANNDAFQQVMDRYATRTNYLKNTMGALASTVLTALLPLFIRVTNVIIEAINAVNEFIAALSGQDSYLKAREVAIEFAEAADDAAASQKKLNQQLMAFDELNVITTPKDNTKGKKEDDKLNDAFYRANVTRFKKIAGSISSIGKVIKDLLPDFSVIGGVFETILETIGQFVGGFIDGFVNSVDFSSIKKVFEDIFRLVGDIFNKLNEWGVPEALGEFLGILAGVVADLTAFGISSALKLIVHALELLHSIFALDIKGIGSSIGNIATDLIEIIVRPITKLLDLVTGGAFQFEGTLFGGATYRTPTDRDYSKYGYTPVSKVGTNGEVTYIYEDRNGNRVTEETAERHVSTSKYINENLSHWHAYQGIDEYAAGGYPSMGSVFVAGEVPGAAEFVGNINGRTGVASGEEITGISEAVYSTGGETNALLRELIAVSSGGNGRPNAAFGKFVTQSLNLYKGVTG